MRAATSQVALRSLDISDNDLDGASAQALATFLGSRVCRIEVLRMAHADIDDNEARREMLAREARLTRPTFLHAYAMVALAWPTCVFSLRLVFA